MNVEVSSIACIVCFYFNILFFIIMFVITDNHFLLYTASVVCLIGVIVFICTFTRGASQLGELIDEAYSTEAKWLKTIKLVYGIVVVLTISFGAIAIFLDTMFGKKLNWNDHCLCFVRVQ